MFSWRFRVFLFLILGAMTLADVRFDLRYEVTGPDIKIGEWQFSKKNQAYIEQAGGEVRLFSADKTQKVSVYKRIDRPGDIQSMRLSADLACCDVVQGEGSGHKALFYLIQYDEKGKSLKTDRIVAVLDGTRTWQSYEKVFGLSEDAVRLGAGAQLNRCTGEVKLKNYRLTPVMEIPYYSLIKGLMLFAWGLFFYALVKDYVGGCSPRARWVLVICFAVILIGTSIPDEARDWVLGWGGIEVPGGGLSSVVFWGLALDEWLHFSGFALFGAVLAFLTPRIPLWLTCLCLVMVSFGTEMVQVFVDSRTAKVFDGLINMGGWLLGGGLVLVQKQVLEIKSGDEKRDI